MVGKIVELKYGIDGNPRNKINILPKNKRQEILKELRHVL